MTQAPFFSVVIPTKNRPKYLVDSIKSVLFQDYDNYELIISDNYNDEETKNACNEFLVNKRVKYFRTDCELSMIDHWEFAAKKAIGEYVIILPDRKLLYAGALKKLHHKIVSSSKRYNCISYAVKHYDDLNNKMFWSKEGMKSRVFSSSELIHNFLDKNYFTTDSLDIYFPKATNSCFKRTFAEEVRKKLGGYFNLQGVTTPDYSSFFINALLNEEVLFIKTPVIMAQGEHISNGRNFGKGNVKSYIASLGQTDPYAFVPVKAPFIYNWLLNDFFVIQSILKSQKYSINRLNYYLTNYYEYKVFKTNPENSNLYFLEELQKILGEEKEETKNSFEYAIQHAEKSRAEEKKNYKDVKRLHLHFRDYMIHNYSNIGIVNRVFKHRFNSSLQAAGFKV